MIWRRTTRRAALLGAAGVVAGRGVGRAAPVSAHVVGDEAVSILACAPGACGAEEAELARAPLGATVELVDGAGPEDGASGRYVKVRMGDVTGVVQDWYLQEDGHSAPYLLQGEAGCGRLALIFNVGIGDAPDLGILDTLARERVPATMFVMGWWSEQRPPALARMVADGYVLGSHGYGAVELTERDDDAVVDDVLEAAAAIELAAGTPPARLFTPYAAAMDARVRTLVAGAGFLPIAWTVAAADYGADATEEGVYERVMAGVHDGALIEMHLDGPASAESTGRALPRLIAQLRADGYRFVTVPDMLGPCGASDA